MSPSFPRASCTKSQPLLEIWGVKGQRAGTRPPYHGQRRRLLLPAAMSRATRPAALKFHPAPKRAATLNPTRRRLLFQRRYVSVPG